jgi:hypothetical protein
LALSYKVSQLFLDDLIESLKPYLRSLMTEFQAEPAGIGNGAILAVHLMARDDTFDHDLIDGDMLVAVAEALAADGEWLQTGDTSFDIGWVPNPEYVQHHAAAE